MPEARPRASGMRAVGAALAMCALITSGVHAQPEQPAGISLSITVRSTSGTPLPYSTVAVMERGVEQFTNERGEFFITGLGAGSYHLRMRQLGFLAKDTVIVIDAATKSVTLAFQLTPIPFLLDKVVVNAVGRCPFATDLSDPANPTLGLIFEEINKNADRVRLLQERYPYTYALWREFLTYDEYLGPRNITRDTVLYASSVAWEYSPGEVVQADSGNGKGQQVMRLPQLVNLAEPAFQNTHCFYYRGTEEKNGRLQHRVDFIPLSDMETPDVEGSIFLDARTYVLTDARFRLTGGDKLQPPVARVEVATSFREIYPGIVIFAEISATQPFPGQRGRLSGSTRGFTELRQKQRLLRYDFVRGKPGDSLSAARYDSLQFAAASRDSVNANSGSVGGTVLGLNRAPIANATVTAGEGKPQAITDAKGNFILKGLVPGDTEFSVSAPGFSTVRFVVDIAAGKLVTVALVLYPDT